MSGANNTFVAHQDGSGNTLRSQLDGSGNSLTVEQFGNRLTYLDRFEFRRNGLAGSVTQRGRDLTLVQHGLWQRPFRIEQTGVGTAVRVSFDNCLGFCTTRP